MYACVHMYVCVVNNLSVRTVEYTDCFSAGVSKTPPNECPGYYTKQSDGEVLVTPEF